MKKIDRGQIRFREYSITILQPLPTVGFEPGTFRLRSERAKRWAIKAGKYRSPKGDRILAESAINSNLYRVIDVVQYFAV